jgi:CheY-like chemotaxis protein
MAKILVSEADPDVRRLLVLLLERLGHEAVVLEADVAVPACADHLLVEPESPACLEQARRVRAYFPDLPVLALNALPAEGDFLTRGPLAYLQKPFTVETMRTTVQQVLSGRRG